MSHAHQIADSADVAAYLFAGKATVTLVSPLTKDRYTFKVKVKDLEDEQSPVFISLLCGSDNESDFIYLGFMPSRRDDVRWSKKSCRARDSRSFQAIRWAVGRILRGRDLAGVEVWHEGACGRCGRKLSVPESIESGIGPHCAKVMARVVCEEPRESARHVGAAFLQG